MGERFLEGRTAMVTGGASGMGRAMALAFAGAGAEVAIGSLLAARSESKAEGELVYLPGEAELEATAEELRALGVEVLASDLDVTSSASVAAFHGATLERFGKVDILANAAGVSAEQTVSGHDDRLWDKVIDVNLNGTYRTIKLCLPGMIERGWGRIVNIASTAASVGAATSAAYCASKAGVVGLSRCVALEGAAHGVSCNAISPTWVETSFGKDWMSDIAESQEGRQGEAYIADHHAGPYGLGRLAVVRAAP
jgi:NAD(P)-dependent dehydrogenase (short-subunit alcohol dehydrogenase family)